jgi:hypothetical protein
MAAVVSGHYEIYITAVVARDHTGHVTGDKSFPLPRMIKCKYPELRSCRGCRAISATPIVI